MERGEEDQIIAMLAETRATNYCDGVFPAAEESLYRNVQFVPDYDTAAPGPVRWVRPGDFARDPDYFKDLTSVVVPGRMNDVWLLGAMAAVAAHPDALVENIFGSSPDDFKQFGVYTVRLYKNGRWCEVVCDTRLPCAPPPAAKGSKKVEGLKAASSPCPITSRSANAAEQWIPLLEKAFAKYHGSYEALNGGDVGEALVDLTGGSVETLALKAPEIRSLVESGRLWDLLELYVADAHICTAIYEPDGPGPAAGGAPGEAGDTALAEDENMGLLLHGTYNVVAVKHIVGFDLIRLACPFSSPKDPSDSGAGCRGHWKGDWSDESAKWDDFPEVAETLRDDGVEWERHSSDGTFWMAFSDFCRVFATLYVCRVFPDEAFKQYCVLGQWKGKSAGGALAVADSDPEELGRVLPKKGLDGNGGGSDLGGGNGGKKAARGGDDDGPYAAALAKRGGGAVVSDDNSSWFNNPQYQLSSDQPCSVYISLMQEDRRTSNRLRDNIGIGFEVVRMKASGNENARAWSAGRSDLVFDSAASPVNCGGADRREVVGSNIYLAPGYVYNVIPHTSHQGMEGSFVLRIFSQTDLRVSSIPETCSVIFPGSWEKQPEREVAGGPLLLAPGSSAKSRRMVANAKWCENPQFVLKLPPNFMGDQVEAKVVLRRITGDDGSGKARKKASAREPTLGIVACKVDPAEDAASRRRQKKAGKRTNAMGEEMPTKESSLKNPRSKFLQQNQQNEQQNSTPSRKLAIGPEDWSATSDYSNTMVASLKLPPLLPSWINDGLVLVPTLSEVGAKGQYQLEVHSDHPLQVEPTAEAKARTLAGEWVDATAGGSHMAKTYKKNPRYHLRLLGPARTKVKITLSRPAGDWKEQMRKDTVGCMLGFYVVPGPSPDRRGMEEIFHDGQPWSETPFVPTHSVGTPAGFELEPLEDEVYTIIPATYEPGKTGPFFLSVVSEGEFTLVKDSGKEKGGFNFGKR